MVHGWGMTPDCLAGLESPLAEAFRVERLALPGHGGATARPGWTAATLARAWTRERPGALWLGWSLGALVALAAAAVPGRVRGLVLVGATPRFRAAPDWPHGMDRASFAAFQADCAEDPERTLRRFLALQVRGDRHARTGLRRLRALAKAGARPDAAALTEGLRVLAETDLRAALPAVDCPTVWISGAEDALTPPAGARAAARLQPRARVSCVPGAGHAPFITHERNFGRTVHAALSELTA